MVLFCCARCPIDAEIHVFFTVFRGVFIFWIIMRSTTSDLKKPFGFTNGHLKCMLGVSFEQNSSTYPAINGECVNYLLHWQ